MLKRVVTLSSNGDVDSKLVMLFVAHLVEWFTMEKSVNAVEDKVFADKEEDHVLGHFNRS